MLIKLSVENFKSFNELVEFSMIESNKYRDKSNHKIRIQNADILKHAVIYGANASGKSNLIEVLDFIQFCLKKRIAVSDQNSFCKIYEENKSRPSKFELQFSVGDKVYAYGFSAKLAERIFTEEWLYELTSSGKAIRIFERVMGEKIEFGEFLQKNKEDFNRLNTYIEDFSENNGELFLKELNRNKKFGGDSALKIFNDVYGWLTKNIIVITPSSALMDFSFYTDESTDKICGVIKIFDTGVTQINIRELTVDQLQNSVSKEIFADIMQEVKKTVESENKKPVRITIRSQIDYFTIKVEPDDTLKITTLSLKHGNAFFDFTFKEESDGTRRLLEILDLLFVKKDDVVFVVDELERSLHPKLIQRFLELFNERHSHRKTQLIFTTHESSIMDLDIFRRDEIWFVERNKDNVSSIYSLDVFKERYDKKLSKAYLEGRYGAIPVFQNFSFEE